MSEQTERKEDATSDTEKLRLECENLRLAIQRLVSRDVLEREELERKVLELKKAPLRTLVLGLLTIIATTATSVGVGFLAFTVSQAGSEQHEREVYQQLVGGLEQPNASVRIGAVTGLGDYVVHPSCGWLQRCRDRSEQTFAMLTGRLVSERDPFVLGSVVQTLSKSDVDSTSAMSELEAVSTELKWRFLHQMERAVANRYNGARTRPHVINDLNEEIFDAINLLAVSDKQASDAFDALYAAEDALLVNAGPRRFLSSSLPRAQSDVAAVRETALQAAAAGLIVGSFIGHAPAFAKTDYLSDTLAVGVNLDGSRLVGTQDDAVTITGSARYGDFSCANFQHANVEGLNLFGTNVDGTDFGGALLPDTDKFKVTTFPMPNLHGSNWYESATVQVKGTYFAKLLADKKKNGTIESERRAFQSARKTCQSRQRAT
jgi:hypothetical protein